VEIAIDGKDHGESVDVYEPKGVLVKPVVIPS
jgi:hypothetical protein